MLKENFFRALPYLPTLLLSPRIFLLKTLVRPSQSLRKWDELGATQAVSGYFSTDAHLAYRMLFSCFRLHVLLEEPLAAKFEEARAQVFNSVRGRAIYSDISADHT